MRQIPLKATLTKELLDLPFEITNYGKVVAVVEKGLNNGINQDKTKKITNSNHNTKATISTGGSYFNPQPKAGQ